MTTNTTTTIEALYHHTDIMYSIISYQNIIDIISFALVCKRWEIILERSDGDKEFREHYWRAKREQINGILPYGTQNYAFYPVRGFIKTACRALYILNPEMESTEKKEKKIIRHVCLHGNELLQLLRNIHPDSLVQKDSLNKHGELDYNYHCYLCSDYHSCELEHNPGVSIKIQQKFYQPLFIQICSSTARVLLSMYYAGRRGMYDEQLTWSEFLFHKVYPKFGYERHPDHNKNKRKIIL